MDHRSEDRSLDRSQTRRVIGGPLFAAAIPPTLLGSYLLFGEVALGAMAATLTAATGLTALQRRKFEPAEVDAETGLPMRETAVARLDSIVQSPRPSNRSGAVLAVHIDDTAQHAAVLGSAAWRVAFLATADRIIEGLRDGDQLVRLDNSTFGVILNRSRRLDIETLLDITLRIQQSIARPLPVGGATVRVTSSVGLCPESRRPGDTGAEYLEAAELAVDAARALGPSSMHVYDKATSRRRSEMPLADELGEALDRGEFVPWLQPQVEAGTSRIIGFEALARWNHPRRGLLSPYHFLEAIGQHGYDVRLFEVMLDAVCRIAADWDRRGIRSPAFGINLASATLLDPMLVEKVRWALDRHDLSPQRLSIEILETVVAGETDDLIVRNVDGLGKLGCRIELDDFGTGHASFAGIRRFRVERIKIDRSFVSQCDSDPEQRRMLSAMLNMAETLGVDTIAEGVETDGEHAVLVDLGCGGMQGYVIARPMEAEAAFAFAERHRAGLASPRGEAVNLPVPLRQSQVA